MRHLHRRLAAAAILTAGLIPGPGVAALVAQSTLDRSVRPSPGPTPEHDFPSIERRRLSNGIELWLVEQRDIPLVEIRLLLRAGSLGEPAERAGLASLTASMLMEGTTTRTGLEIADELGFLAASLNAGAGRDAAVISLRSLSRNLDAALRIMGDVVANPSFPANEWTRVRDLRLVSLRQALDQPTTLASWHFNRQLYGPAHPLGRPGDGTPASVEALTPEVLKAFHAAQYRPDAANLIAVGDFSADRLVPLLEQAFRAWKAPGTAAPPVNVAAPPARERTRVYLIDKPGAAQSEVRIGHVGVPRNHPDYFALLVLNTILGGQFTSRINLNLREDKGYTYGARSAFEMGRFAGPFVASGGVQTAVTRESVIEFMKELEDIRKSRPATDAEVAFAQASLVRREPLAIETHAQIAGRVEDLVLYELPLHYYDTYSDRIAGVSAADVNRAAREHLHPDRFVIVVVGDRSAIEAGLRTLPYSVEILPADPFGEPVR